MTAIRSGELTRMKSTQLRHLHDTGDILVWSSADDSLGLPVDSFAEPVETACGFSSVAGKEVQGESDVLVYDALLRLPKTTTLSLNDRFRLTYRFGEAVTPPVLYEVVGSGQRPGITLGRYLLRAITDVRQS